MFSLTWIKDLIWSFGNRSVEDLPWDSLLPLHSQRDKNEALRVAVEGGDEHMTLWLLERGADANSTNPLGFACIHRAVLNGHHELIKHLIDHGADIERKTLFGAKQKPLHMVAYSTKKKECFQELLIHDVDINTTDRTGDNLLQILSKWTPEQTELIEILIALGLDPNATDRRGNNSMHYLAATLDPEREALAAVFENIKVNLDCRNLSNGETPLHIACHQANPYIVDFLLREGADIGLVDNYGLTAFEIASTRGDMNVYYVFVKHIVLRIRGGNNICDNIKEQIMSNTELKKLYEQFEKELDRLKLVKVTSSCRVSYNQVLCENKNVVAKYIKTINMNEETSKDYNHISKIYNNEIRRKFEEAKEIRKDQEYAYKLVETILDNKLPHLCVEKISTYLNTEDLERLSWLLDRY